MLQHFFKLLPFWFALTLGKWKQSSLSHIYFSTFWISRDFSFSCLCKMSNGEIKAPIKQNNVKWSRALKRSVVWRNNVILWLIITPIMVTRNVTNQWGLQFPFLIVLWLKVTVLWWYKIPRCWEWQSQSCGRLRSILCPAGFYFLN